MSIEIKGEKRERLPRKPARIWNWKEWLAWWAFAASLIFIWSSVVGQILTWGMNFWRGR